MGTNPDSSGLDKHSAHPWAARDPEYAPVKSPYVPDWLPWPLHRDFMRRYHASVKRALARRGGRWRSHRDERRTRWHILGGLTSTFKHGRVGSAWGRRMLAKRGQKALQTKLAMRGEMVVEHFVRIGQRGGVAKARNRRNAYVNTLPPEQRAFLEHQQAVLSGRQGTRRSKSWLKP